MQSFKNPNQTCSIITSIQISQLSRVQHTTRLTTMCRRMFYRDIIKGHLAYTYDGQSTYFWPKSTETNSIKRNQGRTGKNLRIQGV